MMRKQTYRFETRLVDDLIISADFSKKPIELKLNSTEGVLRTHALIIATGADSRWLGVPGEHDFRGGGVSACATCDGFLFRDQDVAVIGGGDTAMEDALVLARLSKSVTVIHRRDRFRASKILADRVLAHPKISVRWNTTVEEFLGNLDDAAGAHTAESPSEDATATRGELSALAVKDVLTGKRGRIAVAAAFVAIGHIPNTHMFDGQLVMDAHGYVQLHSDSGTAAKGTEGVFVAG